MADVQLLRPDADSLEGIGGWLILPLIGLILTPLFLIRSLAGNILPAFEAQKWEIFTSPGSSVYSAYWAPYFIVSAVGYACLAAWAVLLIVLFFLRKRQVPILISVFYLASSLAMLFEFVSVSTLTAQLPQLEDSQLTLDAVSGLIRSVAGAAVWIPYFFRSVRVRNTFVR